MASPLDNKNVHLMGKQRVTKPETVISGDADVTRSTDLGRFRF
jgi:hypothetical protein